MALKPNLTWQPAVQRVLFGASCVIILWHTLVAVPWLFYKLGHAGAGPAAGALIRIFFPVLTALAILALAMERLVARQLPRISLQLAGLSTLMLQFLLLKRMVAIKADPTLAAETARQAWGQLHGVSMLLNFVLLLILAVLYFKSPSAQEQS